MYNQINKRALIYIYIFLKIQAYKWLIDMTSYLNCDNPLHLRIIYINVAVSCNFVIFLNNIFGLDCNLLEEFINYNQLTMTFYKLIILTNNFI